MRETWIDEHTGDELEARPGFRAELRTGLESEWAQPARPVRRRAAPWKPIVWSAAAAALLVGVVATINRDDTKRIAATPTTISSPATAPSSTLTQDLRAQLVDVTWLVTAVDGQAIDIEPTFVLQGDGRLVGFDGCNEYGFDLSLPGGWTLEGDRIALDQGLVGTSMLCTKVPDPVVPIVDGTVLALDASGTLTLTDPDGHVYIAKPQLDTPPTADLVIPAEGGPSLSPEIVATFDMPTDEGGPRVALLPDRFVVLPTDPSHFTGTVLSVDRNGNPLPDTRLESVPADLAGIVLGGYDGTLYVETYPAVENTQTTRAYRLEGDVWREVDSYFVEQNNDGVYRVTGAGLQLGDLVVIAAQSVIEDGAVAGMVSYTPPVTVLSRAIPNGTTTTWEISQAADPLLFPPTPLLFGDGLLFTGDTDALDGGNFVGILRQNGANEFFRLDGWQVAGADDTTALFVHAADGKVRLGVITTG